MAINKIVVAYDGSEGSKKALAWVAELAGQAPVSTVIVNVLEVPTMYGTMTRDLDILAAPFRKNAEDMLEAAAQIFRSKGQAVRIVFLQGHPAAEIIDFANNDQADLLVCGTRGAGGFESLVMGSVAHSLVNYSKTPVLVIK